MALSPEVNIIESTEIDNVETSRTYKIDFENGRITNEIIDGVEAIKQFVYLSLRTPRYSYAIYSSDVGSEIEELLSDAEATIAYKKTELERLVTESLIYDNRIDSINNFSIDHIDDAFHIHFTLITDEGAIDIEEVF